MRGARISMLLLFLASTAFATSADEVLKAFQAKVTITTVNGWTGNIASPGTQLIVRKEGLVAGDPDILNKKTVVQAGQLVSAGGAALGGSFFGNGSAGHDLKVGDRVYIYGIVPRGRNEGFSVKVMTVATYDVIKHNQTKSQHGVSIIDFAYPQGMDSVDTAAVLTDFAIWFKTANEASESRTVKLGQSPTEVEAILGAPEKRIDLGPKKVYVYKDMKIVFVEGKVADVQ